LTKHIFVCILTFESRYFMIFTMKVIKEKCFGCTRCVRVCKTGTLRIDMNTGKAYNTGEVCDNTWDCIKVCPIDALEIVEDARYESH